MTRRLIHITRSSLVAGAIALMIAGSGTLHASAITPVSGAFNMAISYSAFLPTQTTISAALEQMHVAGLGNALLDTGGITPGNMQGDLLNLPSPNQAVLMAFTLGGLAPDLTSALVNGTGSVLVSPITDPTVADFLKPSSYTFVVDSASLSGFNSSTGNGTLVYDFVVGTAATPAVPEPATWTFLSGGALLLLSRLRGTRRSS